MALSKAKAYDDKITYEEYLMVAVNRQDEIETARSGG